MRSLVRLLILTLSLAGAAAAEFLMDYLKTRAPFWKKEELAEGARWVAAKGSDDAAAERWTAKRRPEAAE